MFSLHLRIGTIKLRFQLARTNAMIIISGFGLINRSGRNYRLDFLMLRSFYRPRSVYRGGGVKLGVVSNQMSYPEEV